MMTFCFDDTLSGIESACEILAAQSEKEQHLLSVSADDLLGSLKAGLAIIGVTHDGQAVCYCRLTPLAPGWFELGTTLVMPEFRGRGLNHKMYQVFLPLHDGKNILATTTNQVSWVVGQDLGFVTVPRKRLPKEVWQASCVCSSQKTGANHASDCRRAFGEPQQIGPCCWFRVTPATASRLDLD